MKQLIFYENGSQAVTERCLIKRNAPIAEAIDLATLNPDEAEHVLSHRRTLKVVRNKAGKATAVTIGTKRIVLSNG